LRLGNVVAKPFPLALVGVPAPAGAFLFVVILHHLLSPGGFLCQGTRVTLPHEQGTYCQNKRLDKSPAPPYIGLSVLEH